MARVNNRPAGTPTPDHIQTSDQENRDPTRHSRRDKGKGRMASSSTRMETRLPTRDPDSTPDPDQSRGQKRKRVTTATQEEDLDEEEDAKFKKYYDPDQNAETRRQIKRKSRALQREFNGT